MSAPVRADRRVAVLLAVAAALFVAGFVVGAAFAVLDLAEVVHQLDEHRAGLVLLAAAIAVLHATGDPERAAGTR